MRAFDSQLLRLKQALGTPDDQDVARMLGMTKAAFSARKTRGAFPEDKLKALANDKPELRLDVKYVLTGVSDALERRMAAIQSTTELAVRLYPDDRMKGALVRDVLLGVELNSHEVIDHAIDTYVAEYLALTSAKAKPHKEK